MVREICISNANCSALEVVRNLYKELMNATTLAISRSHNSRARYLHHRDIVSLLDGVISF
jgi:hypothetical protein